MKLQVVLTYFGDSHFDSHIHHSNLAIDGLINPIVLFQVH